MDGRLSHRRNQRAMRDANIHMQRPRRLKLWLHGRTFIGAGSLMLFVPRSAESRCVPLGGSLPGIAGVAEMNFLASPGRTVSTSVNKVTGANAGGLLLLQAKVLSNGTAIYEK